MPKDMQAYSIRKNVPIPKPRNGALKYPWDKMEIGDSVQFGREDHTEERLSSIQNAARQYGARHDRSFVSRTDDNCLTIWRIA